MTTAMTAAVLAGCSAWILGGETPAELRITSLRRSAPPARVGWTALGLTAAVFVVAGLAATLWLDSAVPVLAAPPAAYALRRWRSAVTRAAATERNRGAVAGLCAAFGAELRAGRQAADALIRAAGAGPAGSPGSVAARAHAAATSGGDVLVALCADAEQPGAEALRRLAACWRVAHSQGAGLAAAVDRLVGALQSEQEHRREVAAELAGARATARILAVLPAIGLLMGAGLGAQPLPFLLRTAYGGGCLVAGVVLVAAGLLWTERIARTAERLG